MQAGRRINHFMSNYFMYSHEKTKLRNQFANCALNFLLVTLYEINIYKSY